jgi:hypothetical protein
MRRSNMSPRRSLQGTVVLIAVAASLVLAGCSSAATTGSAEPAPTPSATETVSREAGWFANRIRVCVQNKTSRNLEYAFSDSALDDQLEYLSQPTGTMGPNAFVCGVSLSTGPFADSVTFSYKNSAGNWDYLYMANDKGIIVLSINGSWDEGHFVLKGGKPLTTVVNGHVLDVLVEPNLRTFDKLTAYPYDVKIYDAP